MRLCPNDGAFGHSLFLELMANRGNDGFKGWPGVATPWLEPNSAASQGKAALGDGGSMGFPREGRPWEMVVS